MRVLVTGAYGQLGREVVLEAKNRGLDVIESDILDYDSETYRKIDITDKESVKSVIEDIHPDAIIHCAAWTNVDKAEDPAYIHDVYDINYRGTQNIAEVAREIGAKMVYISTDYVFDGEGDTPWKPDSRDYNTLNVYGSSKLAGEMAVSKNLQKFFIVRISWLFGKYGQNFVKTMINAGKTHDEVRVVNDQIGTPTYAKDLAKLLIDMSLSEKYGYYHVSNEGGYISWYDFCVEIYKQYGLKTKVIPVSSDEYKSIAKRPHNSRLDKSKLEYNGFNLLPTWQDALSRYLKEAEL